MRTIAVLLAPFVLTGCLLTPGKFTSSLRIDADRHFTFTYTGEVIDAEPKTDGASSSSSDDDKPSPEDAKAKAEKAAADKAEADAKNRTLAATLSKEAGYRKVAYLGDGKFMVDYTVSGTLDHTFIWPFNLDGEVIVPFVAIELRQDGVVRVKAPAFSNDDSAKSAGMGGGMPGMPGGGGTSKADGVFTLDTNAEIVSQNNEDGAKTAGGRKTIAWKVTPATKDAPTAVLRLGK